VLATLGSRDVGTAGIGGLPPGAYQKCVAAYSSLFAHRAASPNPNAGHSIAHADPDTTAYPHASPDPHPDTNLYSGLHASSDAVPDAHPLSNADAFSNPGTSCWRIPSVSAG